MFNFAIILFCLAAGLFFNHRQLVPKNSYKAINAWIINIALPAMSFTYLPYLRWELSLVFAFIAPILVFIGSILFFYLLSKFVKLSTRNRVTLSLVAGFSNTSFVGFPLITAYYGAEFIEIGILCDQMTFFLLSSLGVWMAVSTNTSSTKKVSFVGILGNIVCFPPFAAGLLAIGISSIVDMQITRPFFQQLSQTVTPLAFFSIGLQLNLHFGHQLKYIFYALSYILFLAPLLTWGLAQLFHLENNVSRISIFEMAMPALVSTSMVLEKYNLNANLGNAIIGVSIFMGLISTYFWYLLL